ncbi:MAG: hypothetical protein NVS9B3_02280 [Gemmatimonadaceae bacterium]
MEIVRLPKVTMRNPDATPRPGMPVARAHLTLVRAEKPVMMSKSADVPDGPASWRSTAGDVVLEAPPRLSAETRSQFRKAALEQLTVLAARGGGRLTIDLAATAEVDASGLGILVLVQKRAKELGTTLWLAHVPQQVRYLLVLTKLDHLFEFAA